MTNLKKNKIQGLIKLIINNAPFINIRPGIHGKKHATRVLFFTNLLCNLVNVSKQPDLIAITISALLHDCARENDGHDPHHAARSAIKAIQFIEQHKIKFNEKLIELCIKRHCPPPGFIDIEKPIESKIVGDGDKLDRFRFYYQPAPCNPKFFELEESKLLMDISARVNGHSWRSFINNNDSFDKY